MNKLDNPRIRVQKSAPKTRAAARKLEQRPMSPYEIADYVISMMHDGHSRDVALHSAVLQYDLDDETYEKVLKELEPMECIWRSGLDVE